MRWRPKTAMDSRFPMTGTRLQTDLVVAVTGMGKSTWAKAFPVRHPQLIRHDQYHGQLVPSRHQIVYVYLRVPYNGTLSALCLQFFRKVDALLGTNYIREAKALRSIAPMVELMSHVASMEHS